MYPDGIYKAEIKTKPIKIDEVHNNLNTELSNLKFNTFFIKNKLIVKCIKFVMR